MTEPLATQPADDRISQETRASDSAGSESSVRPYNAPKLFRLGSVRDLTLGNSGGRTDVGTRSRH